MESVRSSALVIGTLFSRYGSGQTVVQSELAIAAARLRVRRYRGKNGRPRTTKAKRP
jgi:hypothetical protein